MRVRLALVLLIALALWTRLAGIDFGLPFYIEPDPNIPGHVAVLRRGSGEDRRHHNTQYPHLIARLVTLWPAGRESLPAGTLLTREQHLERAASTHRETRIGVALLSLLAIPATFLLARRFLPPLGSLLAAGVSGTSLLVQTFAQQARPHAAAASFVVLALWAALRLRRAPTVASYLLAGAAAGLALGSLHSAVFVLPPLLLAHLLREPGEGPRPAGFWRRLWDPRLAIPVALLAVSVVAFYPFLFTESIGSSWGLPHVEGGKLVIADHQISLRELNFTGTGIVLWSLWSYEPVLSVLLLVAAAVWLLTRGRRATVDEATPRAARADVAVLLAYALPYLFVLCLFEKTYERFVIPLLPLFGVFAAWGAWRLSERGRSPLARALPAALFGLALLLPAVASGRLAWLRSQPTTLELAADWIEQHVEPEGPNVFVLPSVDLPLIRTPETLRRPSGKPLPNLHSPWARYQSRLADEELPRPRYALPFLVKPGGVAELTADPRAFVRSLGPGYVALEVFQDRGHDVLASLRAAFAAEGELLERVSPDADPEFTDFPLDFQDDRSRPVPLPHYTARVLRARAVGPVVEIYALPEGQGH